MGDVLITELAAGLREALEIIICYADDEEDAQRLIARIDALLAKAEEYMAAGSPGPAVDHDAINEAIHDATCDGEGRANARDLLHHLEKHGLTIVGICTLGCHLPDDFVKAEAAK